MKQKLLRGACGAAVLILALLGCQTAKPALLAPAESQIQVEKSGFSPSGPAGQNSIDISMLYGNGDAIKSWKVELAASGTVHRSWTGDEKYLPASLTWDGKDDAGTMAPDGTYTAKLSIEYASKFQSASAESRSFVLDITPPTGSIAADPSQFTPTDNGVTGPMSLKIAASSKLARMDSWTLDVLDLAGGLVKSWSGTWPNTTVSWDGSSMNGGFVSPSASYTLAATVRDEYGNSARLKTDIAVAALPKAVPAPKPPAPPPPKPGQPVISAQSDGFSPNADQAAKTITLLLGYGQPTAVVTWKVTIAAQGAGTQKTYSGDKSRLPASLEWDGTSDSGAMSPEGIYTATLAVDYGTAFTRGTSTTEPFALDVTPPTGTISLSTPLFSPIEASDTISLKVSPSSKVAKIDSWDMDIYDPGGNIFRSFSGKWPSDTAVWDGKNAAGELVQSAEDYPAVATIRDQFGNVGTAKATVPIDILVEKRGTGYRILASRIFFKAFTADYKDVPPDLAQQNMTRLDALTAKLKKFSGYKINIVGHAVMIYWDDPAKGRNEQKAILIPLSKARAEAVKAALVERGLEESRLSTEGVGASDQLVPDSDYKDRWQNRRVALFLEKE